MIAHFYNIFQVKKKPNVITMFQILRNNRKTTVNDSHLFEIIERFENMDIIILDSESKYFIRTLGASWMVADSVGALKNSIGSLIIIYSRNYRTGRRRTFPRR